MFFAAWQGLNLVTRPELGMFWQGLSSLGIAGLCLVLWVGNFWPVATAWRRGRAVGPTLEPDGPDDRTLAPTTTHLMHNVRRIREGNQRLHG